MTVNNIHSAVEQLSERNLHRKVTNDELQKSMSLFAKSTVKRRWHGVGKDDAGLLIRTGGNIYIYTDESQIVVGANNRIYVWRKCDEVNCPHLVCKPSQRKESVMIWGCLSFNGIRTITITDVKGNINS